VPKREREGGSRTTIGKRGGDAVIAPIRQSIIVATVVAVSWLIPPGHALGQGEALKAPKGDAPSRPTPRTADGKVDFSGIWTADRKFIYDINDALKPGDTLPIQEWALKVTLERLSKDDPEARCLPTGVPRQAPYPWRILQTPTHIFFLFEGNIHSYRQIFMDGRPHPKDPDPTWYGHSVGRFEGDTLVIETVGFNDRFWFDFAGHPHTEKLRTIERFRRPEFGKLLYEVTIDDPGAYTRPFTLYGDHAYEPNTELMEYICNENNQDVEHIVGKDPRNKYTKP
jgi:hypothetical protein